MRKLLRRLEAFCPQTFGTRSEFENSVSEERCLVVVLPNLCDPDVLRWISGLSRRIPSQDWILATDFTPENVLKLLSLGNMAEVVWMSELEFKLPEAVSRTLSNTPLRYFSKIVEESSQLPSELRRPLCAASFEMRPPLTVQGLCRSSSIKETRLRYLWRSHMGSDSSLKVFVDYLILAEALFLYAQCGSWARVASEIGLREGTLRNICRRLTDHTLSHLSRQDPSTVCEAFRSWWVNSIAS